MSSARRLTIVRDSHYPPHVASQNPHGAGSAIPSRTCLPQRIGVAELKVALPGMYTPGRQRVTFDREPLAVAPHLVGGKNLN